MCRQMNRLRIPLQDLLAGRSTCLAVAVFALVTAPLWAEANCDNWNEEFFFRHADAEDVDRCINAGSNPKERDSSGSTPLHFAAVQGGPAQIRALLDHGADLDDRDAKGRTPLHLAAEEMEGSPQNITALADAGASVDASDERGETPLHLAANRGTVAKIKALLDAGADVNARDKRWQQPSSRGRLVPQLKRHQGAPRSWRGG